jgi:hypothetical protein
MDPDDELSTARVARIPSLVRRFFRLASHRAHSINDGVESQFMPGPATFLPGLSPGT